MSRRLDTRGAWQRAAINSERGQRSTRTEAYKQEQMQEEPLDRVDLPPGVEPAHVRVSAGCTYNMGNFESLRVDVSVTLPCDPGRVDEAYQEAKLFVEEKITSEHADWLGMFYGREENSRAAQQQQRPATRNTSRDDEPAAPRQRQGTGRGRSATRGRIT